MVTGLSKLCTRRSFLRRTVTALLGAGGLLPFRDAEGQPGTAAAGPVRWRQVDPPYAPVLSGGEWAEHYGPETWRQFRAAKKRFDPRNTLTPGAGIF